jgi:hypothetical protein
MVMVNRLVGSKNTAPRSTILVDRFMDTLRQIGTTRSNMG